MIQPLLELVEKLESVRFGIPNEVQTSPAEYGYCTAIVVLAVVILESAINRVRDIRKDHGRFEHPADYCARVLPNSKLTDHVAEAFVVRDAIAHGHIWEGEIQDSEAEGLHFVNDPTKLLPYGDRKYKERVDLTSRLTKVLQLNVVPTRIWRLDVLKVLITLDLALRELDAVEYHHIDTTSTIFMFHGEYDSLQGAIERMKRTRLTGDP